MVSGPAPADSRRTAQPTAEARRRGLGQRPSLPYNRPMPPPPAALLTWYDENRRQMPWRALPGETPDPYRVWLSEVMLQQTTVATVGPRFGAFLRRWPTLAALAAAPLDDV